MTNRIPATRSTRNPHDHLALATGDIDAFERLFDEPDSMAAIAAEPPHDPECGCWFCDEEPAYHDEEPDAFERSRDLDVLLGCL